MGSVAIPSEAGQRVARELRHIYHGDAAAAAKDVEELCKSPELIEAWATRMLRAEPGGQGGRPEDAGPNGKPFTWDEVPEAMRSAAIRGMAMAYLVHTAEESEGTA